MYIIRWDVYSNLFILLAGGRLTWMATLNNTSPVSMFDITAIKHKKQDDLHI